MSRSAGCSETPSIRGRRHRRAAAGKRDILRLERFGALYYSREDVASYALTHKQASLLIEALDENLLVAFARDRERWSLTEVELAAQVAEWRKMGLLDEGYRCPAVLLDVDRAHGALSGPMVTHVQLTQACNLRCKHCFVDVMAKPAPDELTVDELHGLFADLQALGSPLVVLAGGEPMVRRDFWEIIAGVAKHELDAWLCTNGTVIDEARAERLVDSGLSGFSVSLDGPDAETHEFLRGAGRFHQACAGIRNLVEAGAEDVQMRVTVTPHNASRLLDFANVARDLGVQKVKFKAFRQSGAAGSARNLFIHMDDYRRAIDAVEERWPEGACAVELGDGMPTRPPQWTKIIPDFGCVGGTTSAAVIFNGKVVACDAVLSPDDWNLRQHSFAECWRHAPTLASWRGLDGNDDCRSCHNFARCGGGCRARSLAIGLGINDPDPWAYCSSDARPEAGRSRLPVVA